MANITVNIPVNDYEVPNEIRQEVVQGICEAFLANNCWAVYHPFSDGAYRRKTDCIIRRKNERNFYGFHNGTFGSDEIKVKFNGAEMKAAFEALISAGYHIFKVYSYGSWKGYVLSKKPFMKDGVEVHEFTDFID